MSKAEELANMYSGIHRYQVNIYEKHNFKSLKVFRPLVQAFEYILTLNHNTEVELKLRRQNSYRGTVEELTTL